MALALLGEGRVWRGDDLIDADQGLADAGHRARHGWARATAWPSSAPTRSASATPRCWSSTRGGCSTPGCRWPRCRSRRRPPIRSSSTPASTPRATVPDRPPSPRGCASCCGAWRERAREPGPLGIQDPYPFRAQPQVDGTVHDALRALEETVCHELNFAGENALIDPGEQIAMPNGNPHAAPLANAIDGLRTALASSAALIAARVTTLLDSRLTGLPPFLARHPGPESGALVLEYTAHAAVAEVRSLVTPVAAQTVSVSRGVESHSSLAPIAARRAQETLRALRVAVATELVVAVRALRLAGQEPIGAGTRALWQLASERLDPDLGDRPLHPDVEVARQLIEAWGTELG